MKQLTTILCALMIILSANATPKRNVKALLRNKPSFSSTVPGTHNIHRSASPANINVTISKYQARFYPGDNIVDNSIFYSLSTADDSQIFYFSIYTPDDKHDLELDKTYTLADMIEDESEWDDDDWNEHYYTEATFKKSIGEGYDIHITATVTDEDGNTYVLSYDEQPVTLTGNTIDVNIENPMTTFNRSRDCTWAMEASNDNYQVQFSYFSADETSCAGQFSGDDIDLYYSYIFINTGQVVYYNDPIWENPRILEASYEITETEERIDAKGLLLASDGNRYNITMFYVKPQKESEATITATNMEIDDFFYKWFGMVEITASNDSNSIKLKIFPDGLGEQMAGTYVIGQNGTNAMITPAGGELEEPGPTNIFSGQFTITYDAGDIFLTGTLLGYNNVEYTIDLTAATPASYAMDNKEKDFTENFASYELDTDHLADYGVIYVNVRNNNNAIAYLEFVVPEESPTLPVSTYTITDSEAPMTVTMSAGANDDGEITYSYVGYEDEQNQLTEIWCLVSGTVTVADNGVITIDAQNINGKKVKSVIGSANGISTTTIQKPQNSGATKHLQKGHLIIKKNGQRFNALGIKMK